MRYHLIRKDGAGKELVLGCHDDRAATERLRVKYEAAAWSRNYVYWVEPVTSCDCLRTRYQGKKEQE